GAAAVAQQVGQNQRALELWRRAVKANPWSPEYRAGLTESLAKLGAWDEVAAECANWLRLDPESIPARALAIDGLMRGGKSAEARALFVEIERLRPPELERWRKWFEDLTKGR